MSQCASPETDTEEEKNHSEKNEWEARHIYYGVCRNEGPAFQLTEPVFFKLRHCLFFSTLENANMHKYQPENSDFIIAKIAKSMPPLLSYFLYIIETMISDCSLADDFHSKPM